MTLIAARARPCRGFDTSWKVGASTYLQLQGAGYGLVARYVRLPGNDASHDIDAAELEAAARTVGQVLLVQHVRSAPWVPFGHSAISDAMAAVDHARAAGYPEGCHIFFDLEGVGLGIVTPDQIKAYVQTWAAQMSGEGYRAGLYVGYDNGLDPEQLWQIHGVDSYWKAPGPWHVTHRSFAIEQGYPGKTVAGVELDEDDVHEDLMGDTPMVCTWVDEAA